MSVLYSGLIGALSFLLLSLLNKQFNFRSVLLKKVKFNFFHGALLGALSAMIFDFLNVGLNISMGPILGLCCFLAAERQHHPR
ncbi:hypothetical protein [Geosporobacter ferrireducens]|uniref:Uncharacterized protein n=1 Tax=Geosporobacter ferrireducens TaxID=1424294 RepID=A0A1D8GMR2_9FIRM|nr:hypothetical protein [Geosporobacter ferrireducens]AOT72223.1 hypothetical protein Gferi_23370 [Geosporobacter ferrireducens]MTI56116.1 hypothetical protein [Geosporobacter ferrireducens]